MKIEALSNILHDGKIYGKGSQLEVSDQAGKTLVAEEVAKEVKAPAAPKKPATPAAPKNGDRAGQ